jgi:hypothetical protein
MKYKADTSELYTDNGLLVKKMQCEIPVYWGTMSPGKNDMERICTHCNRSVLNTEFLSDYEVVFLMKKRPETCIKTNAKRIKVEPFSEVIGKYAIVKNKKTGRNIKSPILGMKRDIRNYMR